MRRKLLFVLFVLFVASMLCFCFVACDNNKADYKVEYYLQNVENDDYSIIETLKLKGEKGAPVFAEVKTIEHCSFNEYSQRNILSGNIDAKGGTVLKVFYTRDNYTITTAVKDETLGSVSTGGTYRYGKEITITGVPKLLGYTVSGWYARNELVEDDTNYTFIVGENMDLVVDFAPKPEMSIFEFVSTETTCEIKELKDGNITKVTIPDGVTKISSFVFDCNRNITEIFIPKSVTELSHFYACSKLTNINVDSDNPNYKSIDGNLYSKDGKTLIQYAIGKQDTTFAVPEEVQKIGSSSFAHNRLQSVIISDKVIEIEDFAFSFSDNLQNVSIGKGVSKIGQSVFAYCEKMLRIIIPLNVSTMGFTVFYGCKQIYVFCEASDKPTTWDDEWDKLDQTIKTCETFWYRVESVEEKDLFWRYVHGIPRIWNNSWTPFF